MIEAVSDTFMEAMATLPTGDRKIVVEMRGEAFTVPEAVQATRFTERAVRRCLQRLIDSGLVIKIAHGGRGNPSRYQVCLTPAPRAGPVGLAEVQTMR